MKGEKKRHAQPAHFHPRLRQLQKKEKRSGGTQFYTPCIQKRSTAGTKKGGRKKSAHPECDVENTPEKCSMWESTE